jgi:hypothetical protein
LRSAFQLSASGCRRSITAWSFGLRTTRHSLRSAWALPKGTLSATDEILSHQGRVHHAPASRSSRERSRPAAPEQHPIAGDRRRPDHCRRQGRLGTAEELPNAGCPRTPTMTGCFRGCRTDHERRLTSSRGTCGRILPRQSLTGQDDHGPAFRTAADLRLSSASAVLRCLELDPHHPEVRGLAGRQIPTTGSTIAEHGGDNRSNRDVAVVVYAPGTVQPCQSGNEVETTLVTPTTLTLLGLSAGWLQAV